MQKYLKKLVDSLTGPKPTFNTHIFSLGRVISKRRTLAQCLKMWNYVNEDDLDREIAKTYFGLVEAIKDQNEPLLLRNASIELFHRYREHPSSFQLEDRISDIVILDCVKNKSQENSDEWFQLYVKIKHYKTAYYYSLERKIFIDQFRPQPNPIRKWYFIELPLTIPQKQPQ